MNNTGQLIDDLESRLKNEPNDVEVLLKLAAAFKNGGDYEKAKACYHRLTELDDSNSGAWLHLGSTEYNLRHFAEAEKCFVKVIRGGDQSGWPWLRLGDTYRAKNQPAEAMKSYVRAADIEGTANWAMLSLGDLFRQEDLTKAREYYRQALQIAPDFGCAIAAMADILLEQEQKWEYPCLQFTLSCKLGSV